MRGVAAGAIVGMPLLYTMEMWWHGLTLSPWHLIGLLGGTLVVTFLFSLLSGMREGNSPLIAGMDAVTSLGIGLVFSAVVLLLIGEIGGGQSAASALGKIVIEAAPVSIGVAFANAQFSGSRTGETDGEQAPPEDPERAQLQADLQDAAATLAGSTVFAFNIAPTEEVLKIASRLLPLQLLLLLGAALVLCYIILFASGLEQHRVHVKGLFQHPVAETAMNGAISLGVAFLLLLVVGQREALASPGIAVASVVVLGLPAIVGGAAGRLIV